MHETGRAARFVQLAHDHSPTKLVVRAVHPERLENLALVDALAANLAYTLPQACLPVYTALVVWSRTTRNQRASVN
eukprot:COSAG02_NODE_18314_length_946_cov_1.028335_2_plen_75_part_01